MGQEASKVDGFWERLLVAAQKRRLPAASQHDVAVALQQLALMLTNGVPAIQAFEILAEQSENERIRNAFDKIMTMVAFKGRSLSGSMAEFPELFPRDVLLMVRAGEESGDIVKRLMRSSELLERRHDLIANVKTSLTSPLITAAACLSIMFLLVKLVLPKFMDMYAGMNATIPMISQMVFAGIKILNHPLFLGFLAVSFLTVYFRWPQIREWLFDLGIRTPGVRRVLGNFLCVHFMDVLASIQADGINIMRGMDILVRTAPFKTYGKHLEKVSAILSSSGCLSEAVAEVPYFPPVVGSMLLVGEESGEIVGFLQSARDFMEMQNNLSVSQAVNVLEPVVIAVMGVCMAVVCVGLFLPIYSILGSLG